MKLYNGTAEYPDDWTDQKIARDQGIRNRIILVENKKGVKTYRAYNTTKQFTITEE
jgi:hypothetical protein